MRAPVGLVSVLVFGTLGCAEYRPYIDRCEAGESSSCFSLRTYAYAIPEKAAWAVERGISLLRVDCERDKRDACRTLATEIWPTDPGGAIKALAPYCSGVGGVGTTCGLHAFAEWTGFGRPAPNRLRALELFALDCQPPVDENEAPLGRSYTCHGTVEETLRLELKRNPSPPLFKDVERFASQALAEGRYQDALELSAVDKESAALMAINRKASAPLFAELEQKQRHLRAFLLQRDLGDPNSGEWRRLLAKARAQADQSGTLLGAELSRVFGERSPARIRAARMSLEKELGVAFRLKGRAGNCPTGFDAIERGLAAKKGFPVDVDVTVVSCVLSSANHSEQERYTYETRKAVGTERVQTGTTTNSRYSRDCGAAVAKIVGGGCTVTSSVPTYEDKTVYATETKEGVRTVERHDLVVDVVGSFKLLGQSVELSVKRLEQRAPGRAPQTAEAVVANHVAQMTDFMSAHPLLKAKAKAHRAVQLREFAQAAETDRATQELAYTQHLLLGGNDRSAATWFRDEYGLELVDVRALLAGKTPSVLGYAMGVPSAPAGEPWATQP